MAAPDPKLDPVSGVVFLLSIYLGSEIAAVVGPYAVILGCGACGAGYGLSRWRACSVGMGALYIAGMTLVTLVSTIPAVELAHTYWPSLETRWLIAPAAMVIGAIGHDWPTVGRAVLRRALNILQRKADAGQEQ